MSKYVAFVSFGHNGVSVSSGEVFDAKAKKFKNKDIDFLLSQNKIMLVVDKDIDVAANEDTSKPAEPIPEPTPIPEPEAPKSTEVKEEVKEVSAEDAPTPAPKPKQKQRGNKGNKN